MSGSEDISAKKRKCGKTSQTLRFSISGSLLSCSLLLALIMAISVKSVNAQKTFYSQKVHSLYNVVNHVCAMDSSGFDNMVIQCTDLVKGDTVPIILCKDENGVVDHIGYCFLPDSIRMVNFPIVQFIEREMLAILTAKDIGTVLRSDTENGLQIKIDDSPINRNLLQNKKKLCSMLKGNRGIIINKLNTDYCVTILCSSGQQLSFLFPADCKLISGMDKREQEIRLAFQLRSHIAKTIDSPIPLPDINYLQLLQDSIYQDSIYVEKGERFNIPQINNDLFFLKKDSIYTLVSDTSLVALSFSNAVLVPSANHYTFDVKHRMYGFVVQKYTIDSRDFNDFFSNGYERYFGIETMEPENLSGTLILYNRDEEYIHLVYVTTTLDDLMNGGKMTMELYSNIPHHNIKSLFGER